VTGAPLILERVASNNLNTHNCHLANYFSVEFDRLFWLSRAHHWRKYASDNRAHTRSHGLSTAGSRPSSWSKRSKIGLDWLSGQPVFHHKLLKPSGAIITPACIRVETLLECRKANHRKIRIEAGSKKGSFFRTSRQTLISSRKRSFFGLKYAFRKTKFDFLEIGD
jgi:hypothetical protein